MDRRRYLSLAGAGVGLPAFAGARPDAGGRAADLSVDIVETNDPVEAGDLLSVIVAVENAGRSRARPTFEFLVGGEPSSSTTTVPVDPGTTETVEFQHRTFPVLSDVTFPVRVETDADADERTVAVAGVDALAPRALRPSREVVVRPGTTLLLEVDDDSLPDGRVETHWFVDGEYTGPAFGPRYAAYLDRLGSHHRLHVVEEEGTDAVVAAVVTEESNVAARWEVTAAADGDAPPTVDGVRPPAGRLATGTTHALELDASSPDAGLDRVVWWVTGRDVVAGVSDVDGSADTASIDLDVSCPACEVAAWVVDRNNAVTEAVPWAFDADVTVDGGVAVDGTGS